MTRCLVCRSTGRKRLLDFGQQPVSSHFCEEPSAPLVTRPLELAVCPACRIVQLERPYPFADLVPPFAWVTYREPEDHLDDLVARIRELPNVTKNSVIAGLSYKDRTTLDRFLQLGISTQWQLDPAGDLGATQQNANIETVHGLLSPTVAARVAKTRGPADVLIVRHIAEHAERPSRFLKALEQLVKPRGVVAIEVPDCERNLQLQDYTMVWEEHSLYLTEETLPSILSGSAFVPLQMVRYAYPFEDVLVLLAQRRETDRKATSNASPIGSATLELAEQYAAAFGLWTRRLDDVFTALRAEGPLALYGAGHLTAAFLNLHQLAQHFEFVVDDTAEKQGLFLPGSALPIVPASHLAQSEVKTCLLGLAPEIEGKVIANNRAFTERGGIFRSIFAASERSIRSLVSPNRD